MRPRVGLIGCGNWGRHILRDLLSLGAEVHVAAASPQSRATAIELGAARAVEPIAELGTPDGYIVATPSTTHADVIEELLLGNRPIFVEKPMTTSAAAARQLTASGGDRIFVMDKWRYHPGVEAMAAMAKSGELGRVLAIRSFRLGWGNPHADVDATWILLPHDLAIAYEILGHLPPASAARTLSSERRSNDFIGVLSDAEGPTVTMEIGTSHPVSRRSVVVVGSERTVQLADSYDQQLFIADGDPSAAHGAPYQRAVSGELPLLRELRAFLDYLRGGPPPRSSAAEGLMIVERIAALRQLAGLAN